MTGRSGLADVIDPAAHLRPAERLRRCRAALLVFAAAALGVWLGRWTGVSPALWFVLAGALACAALVAGRTRAPGFVCCALAALALLMAGWTALRVATPTTLERRLAQAQEGAVVAVEGVVTESPTAFSPRGFFRSFSQSGDHVSWRFALRAARLAGSDGGESEAVRGRLWVWSTQRPPVEPGQRVRVVGAWRPLKQPTNPGEIDPRPYARERGFAGELRVEDASLVRRVGARGGGGPLGLAQRMVWAVRSRAMAALDALTEPVEDAQTRALLRALLLGERAAPLAPLQEAGQATGLAHILAISGLHIAALAALATLLLRLLRDWGRLELVMTAAATLLYTAALPLRAPALRATIMILAFLGAELAGRRWDRLATLALAATLTLALQPMELFSAGFALSYTIVAGLILGAPLLDRALPGGPSLFPQAPPGPAKTGRSRLAPALRWTLSQARSVFVVSLCAWMVSTPIVAWRFGMATLLTPLLSVVALPLLLAVLFAGGLGLACAAAIPATGPLFAPPAAATGRALAWLMSSGAALPGAGLRIPPFPLWWVFAVEALLLLWLTRPLRSGWRLPAAAALALASAMALSAPTRNSLGPRTAFRLDMLDVGDGSCLLLRAGADAALWDCGSQAQSRAERTAPQALRALGVGRLRWLFLTHADMDHYAAAPRLAHALRIEWVVVSAAMLESAETAPDGPVAALLAALRREGVAIVVAKAGDVFTLGDSTLRLLWPDEAQLRAFSAPDNASSLAAVVETPTAKGTRRTLLTGDLGLRELERAVEPLGAGPIDAMEAPHHGSAATRGVFIAKQLQPRFVLQSTGPSRLDDPRLEPLQRQTRWLATARSGALTLVVERSGEVRAWSCLPRGAQRPHKAGAERGTGQRGAWPP